MAFDEPAGRGTAPAAAVEAAESVVLETVYIVRNL